MFRADHELRYRIEGIEKPKKKRGRPPRPTPEMKKALEEAAAIVRKSGTIISKAKSKYLCLGRRKTTR